MASYQTVPAPADEPLLQKPKSSSGKYIMAVAFVATFAIHVLAIGAKPLVCRWLICSLRCSRPQNEVR